MQKAQVQNSGFWSVCACSRWVSLPPLRAESSLLASQDLLREPASDPAHWGSLWIDLLKINVLPK